ncbi:pyruvate kinase [Candidatus Woesearchaeota archaeon]|nr:pyruvate kinase [Candidatus Woesearchaeota archaeon]
MRFTKIVCTVGPATDSDDKLKKLIDYRVDIIRLNLSHGTHEYHKDVIKRVRSASNKTAIMLDTKGPEIRTDELKSPFHIKKKQVVILSTKGTDTDKGIIKQDCKSLPKGVKKDDIILIDDGMIELRVLSKTKDSIKCLSLSETVLGSRKSLVVPGAKINLPDLTEQDYKDIEFGIKQGVDFIALSLVKKASIVAKVKSMIEKAGKNISVIAKIEHPDGVHNLGEILEVSDGILVARGDLGLNVDVQRVPIIQKKIIRKANEFGKPVIVATQMLESMVNATRPTRAEVSDVANAILDGADAVMLSEETAAGKYPMHAVREMICIIEITDPLLKRKDYEIQKKSIPEAISRSVAELVDVLDIKALFAPTVGGFTPVIISKYRPKAPIFALSKNLSVMRKMAIVRGVFQYDNSSKRGMLYNALSSAYKNKIVDLNDLIIVVFNHDVKNIKTTNCLEIRVVGEILKPELYHRKDISHSHHGR